MTRSAVKPAVSYRTVSVETQEKEEGHADQVQGRLDMCLEQIKMLRTEPVGTALDDPHAGGGVTMTYARKLSERRWFDSVRGHRTNRGDTRRRHRGAQWWSERSGHQASEVPLWG